MNDPTATQLFTAAQATAPSPASLPTSELATVVQVDWFHVVVHGIEPSAVALKPAVTQLALLAHETLDAFASPCPGGGAIDSRAHFTPFQRNAYGRRLRPSG